MRDSMTFVVQEIANVFLRDTFAVIVAISMICFGVLVATGRDWRRYFSGQYITDWLYTIFYAGGFYIVLAQRPFFARFDRLVDLYLPGLRMNLSAGLPYPLQVVVALLAMDFCAYWGHRFLHVNRWLWIFHSIHHSQEKMTTVTNFRLHFVDFTFRNCVSFIPAMIVGLPLHDWLPFRISQMWIEQASHGDIGWTYGWLGRIFVSPRYHFVHHSSAPGDANRNYSMILTVWDAMFGTAKWNSPRDVVTGIHDWRIPESFFVQLWFPFVLLWRQLRARPVASVPVAGVYQPPA